MALGFVVPRLMIGSYGSDLNGLLSTTGQIFTYLALLEAGIGQAAKNALYGPLARKDYRSFSEIASAAQKYYRHTTLYYAIGVIAMSVIAPFIFATNIDRSTIFAIIILEGMSGVLSYYFIQTKNVIVGMSGNSYVNTCVSLVTKVATYAVKIVLAALGINIILLQVTHLLITLGRVVFYSLYFKKQYTWVDFTASGENVVLKDRNSYIITEIAWTIFSSTDMIILSIFVSTQLSSVYSVYNMVFANLTAILSAVYYNATYMLGLKYHESIQEYEKFHDAYTSVFLGAMTVCVSVAYSLIIPFVRLYTKGVADVEYVYRNLPLLFCLIQILSWSRYVSGNLTGMAGYAKPTSRISLIEACINVVLSLVFVNIWGIFGVLLATVIALPLKAVYCAYIADKKVMKRSYAKTLKIWGVNYGVFAIAVAVEKLMPLQIESYGSFFLWGVVLSLVFGVLGIAGNALANQDAMQMAAGILFKRK